MAKISRRRFTQISTISLAALASANAQQSVSGKERRGSIRLGGPVFEKYKSPREWVEAHKMLGYRAAWCPLEAGAADEEVKAYAEAADKAGLAIAETGAWSNPLSADEKERGAAIAKCRSQLELADRIGARCCVNISGSRGSQWDGPDPKNLTEETFEMIVEVTRAIIDGVKPRRTYFTLETMPWAYPDSADSYLRLLKAVDRERFAVHLDPVNLICSPRRYFDNAGLIRDFFARLGPHIKSCHAKDILLQTKLTTHLDEVLPGAGGLDYGTYLRELSRLDDIPLMLEHLETAEEFQRAAEYIRSVGAKEGLVFG